MGKRQGIALMSSVLQNCPLLSREKEPVQMRTQLSRVLEHCCVCDLHSLQVLCLEHVLAVLTLSVAIALPKKVNEGARVADEGLARVVLSNFEIH